MKIDKNPTLSGPVEAVPITPQKSPLFGTTLLLLALLAVIFWRCFIPAYVLFSNDGPYGALVQEDNRMPSIMRGLWANMNWFGNESLSPAPSVSSLMRILTSPLVYAKILCPVSLFIAGLGACFCFRKLRLAPAACVLGGVAAALNSDFFSTSCWGVATQCIGFGFLYIAVGLIADTSFKRQWVRIILAGMAVGIAVMEAYDIGALFSLFVAAFVVYQALFLNPARTPVSQKAGRGVLRLALVAGFAGFIASHAVFNLVGTQIKGISGMDQDARVKAEHWAEATIYSTPVPQTLQVVVPGIFGFRDNWYLYEYDSPHDDQFWSMNGAHPIGTGLYAGVPVVVIALWAAFQAFRKRGSPFTDLQRRAIWFWIGTLVISVLMAYGKHAPFYQLFYALPYSSTIRNPQKFMHVAQWALVILFGYGMHGLVVGYMRNRAASVGGWFGQFKTWFGKATAFERKWMIGCGMIFVLSLVSWLIYTANRTQLIEYVQTLGISPTEAPGVVRFSFHAVGWFLLFFMLTVGLLGLIFSGQFSGARAKWGCAMLGTLLVIDLGRADAHWILYWDLDYMYAKDPVVDFLADKPYEHRVALLPVPPNNADQETARQFALLVNSYQSDWKQHLFPFYNIQCAEVVQEPRRSMEKEMFERVFPPNNPLRTWQLLNCRYLLGVADWVRQNDPKQETFRILKTFDFVSKPLHTNVTVGILGLTTTDNGEHTRPAEVRTEFKPDGKLAIIEFVGALPRATLFSHWEASPDENATLQILANPQFDLFHDVLVDAANLPKPSGTNTDAGTVQILPNYKSKRIEMAADVKTPAVLLLSERYNPKWQVEVDGKPAPLLRGNFIERAVFLTPREDGKPRHVVMRFAPPIHTLWISLAAIVLAVGLWAYLIFAPKAEENSAEIPNLSPKEKRL